MGEKSYPAFGKGPVGKIGPYAGKFVITEAGLHADPGIVQGDRMATEDSYES
jgi:hypothetical protein